MKILAAYKLVMMIFFFGNTFILAQTELKPIPYKSTGMSLVEKELIDELNLKRDEIDYLKQYYNGMIPFGGAKFTNQEDKELYDKKMAALRGLFETKVKLLNIEIGRFNRRGQSLPPRK